jgi:glycosyltransferase involved in cell wall biosynthesis
MLKVVPKMPKTLDRAKWHKPLVSIIVTHHNYSAHLEDALLSLLDQTHGNWECVVVDDGSDDTHRAIADLLVETLHEPRIRFLALDDNVGQIPAFFAGLAATKGEFVCPLDPDDRYAPTFLEEMLTAHLNPALICALVCCEQMLLRNDQVITGVQTGHIAKTLSDDGLMPAEIAPTLRFFPAATPGWHWSTTSSMMFRRPVLEAMQPNKTLGYKRQIDAYIAPGAHMLGGSMFFTKPLIYRGVHEDNSWQRGDVFGHRQRPKGPLMGQQCRADVIEAIIANGYEADLARAKQGKRNLRQRLTRSIAKRWRKLTGAQQ